MMAYVYFFCVKTYTTINSSVLDHTNDSRDGEEEEKKPINEEIWVNVRDT